MSTKLSYEQIIQVLAALRDGDEGSLEKARTLFEKTFLLPPNWPEMFADQSVCGAQSHRESPSRRSPVKYLEV
jgi:hypothetical protein